MLGFGHGQDRTTSLDVGITLTKVDRLLSAHIGRIETFHAVCDDTFADFLRAGVAFV